MGDDTPQNAARKWYQAVADFDGLKVDDLPCDAEKEKLRQGGLFITAFGFLAGGMLGQSLMGQTVKADVSGLEFTIISSRAEVVDVHVGGRIRSAIGLAVQSQQLDQVLHMVWHEGKWKFCGEVSASGSVTTLKTSTAFAKIAPRPSASDSGLEVTVIGAERVFYVDRGSQTPQNFPFIVTLEIRNTETSGAAAKLDPASFQVTGDRGLTYEANPKNVTIEDIMTARDAVPPGSTLNREPIFPIANDADLTGFQKPVRSWRQLHD